MKLHLWSGDDKNYCGSTSENSTDNPSDVTCLKCKKLWAPIKEQLEKEYAEAELIKRYSYQ